MREKGKRKRRKRVKGERRINTSELYEEDRVLVLPAESFGLLVEVTSVERLEEIRDALALYAQSGCEEVVT